MVLNHYGLEELEQNCMGCMMLQLDRTETISHWLALLFSIPHHRTCIPSPLILAHPL